jgi:hypothetical protein
VAVKHVSPSSWALFEQCRFAWAMRYVEGIRDDGSVYTAAGSAFHEVPELVYMHEPDVRLDVAPVAKELAVESWADEYERHGGTADELERKVDQWWLALISMEYPFLLDVVSTEERHETTLNGVPVVLVTDRVVRVQHRRRRDLTVGRLDDFKTGKKKPARRQMVMGAACIEQRHDIKVPEAHLIYVATGEVIPVLTGEVAQRSVLDDLARVWDEMREAELTGDWPANPGPLCSWRSADGRTGECPYLDKCPAGQKYVRQHGGRRRS